MMSIYKLMCIYFHRQNIHNTFCYSQTSYNYMTFALGNPHDQGNVAYWKGPFSQSSSIWIFDVDSREWNYCGNRDIDIRCYSTCFC
jgi:hypothetical protein